MISNSSSELKSLCSSRETNKKLFKVYIADTQRGMVPQSETAICVQKFDDSQKSAIHITYRSSLRSSSMHKPRDPPSKVVLVSFYFIKIQQIQFLIV